MKLWLADSTEPDSYLTRRKFCLFVYFATTWFSDDQFSLDHNIASGQARIIDTVDQDCTGADYLCEDAGSGDADGDGICDGLDGSDSDGDGFTDAEEVACGSLASDPNDRCFVNLTFLLLLLE